MRAECEREWVCPRTHKTPLGWGWVPGVGGGGEWAIASGEGDLLGQLAAVLFLALHTYIEFISPGNFCLLSSPLVIYPLPYLSPIHLTHSMWLLTFLGQIGGVGELTTQSYLFIVDTESNIPVQDACSNEGSSQGFEYRSE